MSEPPSLLSLLTSDEKKSYLDQDDLNGPGAWNFPQKTGDPTVDFALFKITRFKDSDTVTERRQFAKEITQTARELGNRVHEFLPAELNRLVKDVNVVKLDFISQLPRLVEYLLGVRRIQDGHAEDIVLNAVVPLFNQLLYDGNNDVVQSAAKCLLELTPMMQPDDRGSHILTTVLRVAHDDENEEVKMLALGLLNQLAPTFGKDLCEQFIVMEFICLSDEPNPKMRKTVAASIGKVSQVVSQPCFEHRLFPIFKKLAGDPNYGVRRAAADSITDVAKACTGDYQREVAQVAVQLVADAARWVKVSMMGQVGPLIAALAGSRIPNELVVFFVALVATSGGENDGDGRMQCAYNFPAVLLTLGREHWEMLSQAYHQLVVHNELQVRKCMASSLHEIAKILGPELAESELVQTFRDFFGDLEQVRLAAFSHFAAFVACLGEKGRESLLKEVRVVQHGRTNWRLKELLASQIADLVPLYSAEACAASLFPVAVALAEDNVYEVRNAASFGLGVAISVTYGISSDSETKVNQLLDLYANHESCIKRMQFLRICEGLSTDPSLFDQLVAAPFMAACGDKVTNNRIKCAEIVAAMKKNPECPASVAQMAEKLKIDADSDVRFMITGKYDVQRGLPQPLSALKKKSFITPPILRPLKTEVDYDEIVMFSTESEGRMDVLKEEIELTDSGFPVSTELEFTEQLASLDFNDLLLKPLEVAGS